MTTADAGVNRHAFSPRFALLLLASTCATVAAGAVAPVLPRFVESSLGGSNGVVGVVVALSPLCSLVGTLAAGPQVDRFGRRWTPWPVCRSRSSGHCCSSRRTRWR